MRRRTVAELCRGGGVPATMDGGGWAWELHWGEVKPFPRLFCAGRGRNDELDGKLRTAAMLCRGGGVPAREQGHGGVGEHRWRAWKLLGGSVLEDGGRRSELHGSRATAAMGAAAAARR